MNPIHPRLEPWLLLGDLLGTAAESAAQTAQKSLRRRPKSGRARRLGADTPLWNACREELLTALLVHGAKARLARYLGIPKQRVTDFLRGNRRMPDAEVTLRLLHWLSENRAARDVSL